MILRIPILIGFFLLPPLMAEAQLSPYSEFQYLYDQALELFEKEKYGAASKRVESFLEAETHIRDAEFNDLHANARYLQAVSAYHLERNDAEALMTQFLFEFSENTKAVLIRYYLGKYYYNRRNYREAIDPLLIAYQSGALSQERFDEVVFMLAYSYFENQLNREALRFFEIAARRDNVYKEDALYYRSVILYQDQDYQEAYYAFQDLKESKKYGRETRVYLANTLLKLKKYDELYVLADELIRSRARGKDAQIYYIVANASFERNDFPRTTEFFSRYVDNRGRMNQTDYFRYAYAHYKQNAYQEARPLFEQALGRRDSLEQVASYYLGFCFLELGDQNSAKVAFQRASQAIQGGNPEITEDALYQYGKVSFATESYDEALSAFTQLREEFPGFPHQTEIQSLIGEIYLYTRDYPRSIRYFESIPINSNRARKAYQTVCYFYALELYERPDYDRARIYFQKVIDLGYDRDMALSAQYWIAESKFRQGDFAGSLSGYRNFLNMRDAAKNEYYAQAFYGIGWAYFKQKNYSAAVKNYEEFIARGGRRADKNLVVDAYLRTGDSYFLQRQYSKANSYYQQVLDFRYTFRDYAAYQLAESYYRQGQYQKSVATFDQLIRNARRSELRDNALDRISEIYATWIKDNNQAAKYAQMLVKDYPRSPLAGPAYNRLALASYYSGQEAAAIRYFKKVLTDYSQDKTSAQVALDNLSGLLSEDEFDTVLRDYRNRNPQMDTNLAGLVFNTGKDRFFAANYNSAIEQFTTYIRDYKNGPDFYEALLFRARSYRELGRFDPALRDYQEVYSTPSKNDFTNFAYQEAAEIHFELKNYSSSLALYQELERSASKLQNRVQALFGIAKNQKAMNSYSQTISTLRNIADNAEVDVASRTKAKVEIGHAHYLSNNFDQAVAIFQEVEADFKNASGAESQYMVTRIQFEQGKRLSDQARLMEDQGNLNQAENLRQQARQLYISATESASYLKNNYPTFNYWKAKTFLVAADAYYQLGNSFQAKGTLQSLIEEDRFPDVQAEARAKLDQILAEEAALNPNPGDGTGG